MFIYFKSIVLFIAT